MEFAWTPIPYPDKNFMARWVQEVLNEYPKCNIVGEVWFENNIANTAYWQRGSKNKMVINRPCRQSQISHFVLPYQKR
jgi:hypothetical protein